MTTSRRVATLPLLLIGLAALVLAALVALASAPSFVHAQDETPPTNQSATGRPVVLAGAQGAGILFADTEGIADGNGRPFSRRAGSYSTLAWSYQWIRVDGNSETNVGADSASYQPVEADVGKLIKVQVSFTDGDGFDETVTSLPFGPIVGLPSRPATTLVSNTGQSASATAMIDKRYAVGFRLGDHGQGYDISSVSIELAAVPSSLTVSLWSGGVRGSNIESNVANKLFDFANPSSFAVGLNEFTAPAGAFAYQNVNYYIVLSGFGSSLSIKETTSDAEDAGGETGAVIFNGAAVRALSVTGQWSTSDSRPGVLRLAVEGSRRDRGILAASYAQPRIDDMGTDDTSDDVGVGQEIISVGDNIGFGIELGAADRYLIRGFSYNSDDTTGRGGGFSNPFVLYSGSLTTTDGSLTGAKQFRLANTRKAAGLSVWTAPQGATVTGGREYVFYQPLSGDTGDNPRRDAVLTRIGGLPSKGVDSPAAAGVSLTGAEGDVALAHPYMAVLGDPLDAMVQNLGQTDDGYVSLGGASATVLSQGFTTGSDEFGYRLQGIGVNIEGSNGRFPDGPTSVSAAVHADSNGKPGAKLFDLVSPGEFGAGHSFFEAPPGTTLDGSTSYVLVWRYNDGAWHRLQVNSSNDEDSGALAGSSIADTLHAGPDLANLAAESDGKALEIAVYGELGPDGHPVRRSWLHIPEGADVGYQFRVVFVTLASTDATSGNIEDYNTLVQDQASREYNHRRIRAVASEFKAVVCTAEVDARTNTGMTGATGFPVHWLDGGWQDHPTLIAETYDDFYSSEWVNHGRGAYSTGNAASFGDRRTLWTGCTANGEAHPDAHMGSAMEMVAVGTPTDPAANNAPLGAVDADTGYVAFEMYVDDIKECAKDAKDAEEGDEVECVRSLYAISPVFRVVP